jgi:hypothetical protein
MVSRPSGIRGMSDQGFEAMFVPPVAKTRTKSAAGPANKLVRPRLRVVHQPDREAAPGVSWDFSRIPVFPSDRANRTEERLFPLAAAPPLDIIQRERGDGRVSDPLENQADRIADQVMNMGLGRLPRFGRDDTSRIAAGETTRTGESSGRELDSQTREFFEARFRHDFSQVRIHNDERAGQSARQLGALAYTIGNDVMFGAGQYQPRSVAGGRLLAHELMHVVQQRRGGQYYGRVQPKLIASGDAAGFAAFANSVIAVQYEVVVSATGEVSLKGTNVAGPPTREAQQLVSALQTSINDVKLINMEFIHGASSVRPEDASVLGGNYALSRVDLDDLSALGTQESGVSQGRTGGSILVHEVTEQYRKQVLGEAFPAAHAQATGAEEAAIGATRGAERYRQVNATTLEVTIPYTYPDGHIVEVTWDIVNGNYGNVRRKVLPAPVRPAHP